MNKVLIVGRYYGSRMPGLLKYLPEFGWQPVFLTTTLPADVRLPVDISVTEVSYRYPAAFWKKVFFKGNGVPPGSSIDSYDNPASGGTLYGRLLSRCAETINYPDDYKHWKKPAAKAGDDILRRDKIDAIISISSPVTGHLIARELKKRHGLPWIADLLDLWSQNHNYYYSSLRKCFDKRLELKTLADADALVTVSRPWADRLATLHPGKSITAITNGFDPEVMKEVITPIKPGFTITYTGNIYRGKQHPGRLFAALRRLIDDGLIDPVDVAVRFYGPRWGWLDQEIAGYNLSDIVKQYGMVPPRVAIEKQKESQLLLLLDWDDPAENGVYPMKIFEYLGAARPVLATGGVAGNVIGRLLEETKAGVHAVTSDSIEASLREFYQDYKKRGEIPYHGQEAEISKYSHREMTGKFVAILDGLLER